MSSGRFVTFEGGEGAGKSTQIARLANSLRGAGIEAVITREPGGSPLAERIRDLLLDPQAGARSALTETLLFSAARADHIDTVIAPSLDAGQWVLSDRFADSTRAYQGAADGVSREMLDGLEAAVLRGHVPDLTVLLDLPAEEGLRRANVRANDTTPDGAQDRFELRDIAFHNRLRDGFLAIAAAARDRFIVIDATQDVEVIADGIWSTVRARFEVDA